MQYSLTAAPMAASKVKQTTESTLLQNRSNKNWTILKAGFIARLLYVQNWLNYLLDYAFQQQAKP